MNVVRKPAAEGNYAVGRRLPISRITWHHIAGDALGAIARFQTPDEQVSADYVIGSDGTIYQCVDEANTAYCDGNADSNARTISIEHAGGIASVPYTDRMYAASIELVKDLIDRYGITDFQRHRDVIDRTAYPGGTACPGELDVERIIEAAQGGDVAEKTTLSTMRILTNGIFGHNGLDGRQNALSGTEDQYLTDNNSVGKELTNDLVEQLFYSGQARQWRDSQDPNSVAGINKRLELLAQSGIGPALLADLRALLSKYKA
jgi:hypothetical protein